MMGAITSTHDVRLDYHLSARIRRTLTCGITRLEERKQYLLQKSVLVDSARMALSNRLRVRGSDLTHPHIAPPRGRSLLDAMGCEYNVVDSDRRAGDACMGASATSAIALISIPASPHVRINKT